tara:strand:- start:1958 stop:3163 length:1206 start_codon:yes stop_codon:yes gene_type:complete
MSQLNQTLNDHLPDTLYFDLQSTNFKSTTTQPGVFKFNETRSNPFCELPDHYDISILRATIDTGTVPLFIPSIQPNQGDTNETIYSVTVEGVDSLGATLTARTYVSWNPQDKEAATPLPPNANVTQGAITGVQDNTTGYYNCYSYSWFLYLVYVAMGQALAQLDAAGVVWPTGTLPNTPIISWDPTRQCAILQCQLDSFNVGSQSFVKLYFNAPLFALFNSFPAKYVGYSSSDASEGRNFQIEVVDIGGSNTSVIFPSGVVGDDNDQYNVINVTQEYSTTASWSPITAIVFTSNTLPIEPNQVSTPYIFINGIPTLGGNDANQENIITDIVSSDGNYRPNLVYYPTAEYRRIHMYGNRPLHNLDINIHYRLKSGQLIPFRLFSGGVVTLKIGFLKKDKHKN